MTGQLRAAGCGATVTGNDNAAIVEGADLVVVAFPFDGVDSLLPDLAPQLAGKIVLDAVNPLVMKKKVFRLAPVPEGSAGEAIQARLPQSRVVGAFKNESAEDLKEIERPLHGDVLVCGEDAEARKEVLDLVNRIPDLRGIDAGPLVNARSLEAITALLLNLNRRHHVRTSIRILGL
jgi:NADPH-dependent F420 reductase